MHWWQNPLHGRQDVVCTGPALRGGRGAAALGPQDLGAPFQVSCTYKGIVAHRPIALVEKKVA